MRTGLRLVLIAVFALLTAGPHVLAQNDSASVYTTTRPGKNNRGPLDWLFGSRAARPDPRAADQRTRTYQPRKRTASAPRTPIAPAPLYGPPMPPDMVPQQGAPQVADETPQAPVAPQLAPVSVAVVGDSLSVFLAQGLQETYADRPSVTFVRRNRESSGLVRDDYFDWPKAMRELTGSGEKLDAIIIMLGSNDRQQLRDESGAHDVLSEYWRGLYTQRVDSLMALAKARNVPVIWVGLPIMRLERYSVDLAALNAIYKARAAQAGIAYVDVWEAFAGDDGLYAVNGPDVGGEIVRLRTPDGVHFTKSGARKLAFFVDKELQKVVAAIQTRLQPEVLPGAPTAKPAPDGGALVMLPPTPDSQPAGRRSIDSMLGVALPDLPAMPTLAPRPPQGPVIALTAPVRAAGGALARDSGALAPGEALSVYRRGLPLSPKPGRIDDFRVVRD
ncbi:MAG: DUF459 domain-containing protein [Proteobacteria bacterium]|nr:DUF459 domain-containing protein [Pseudomonadota bacterium]